jgi:hypothetical protein
MQEELPSSDSEISSFSSEFEQLDSILPPSILPTPTILRPATFIYPTIPTQPSTMTTATPTNTVLNMPIPKTKLAPETFRGDYSKVKDFIEHYDRLLLQHNVHTHKDKCETITRYCGRREKETIKNIPSYSTPDWTRLREDILKVYDADRDTKRYTLKDVMSFARRKQRRRIADLAAWKQYVRSFLRVAGSLLNNHKLTQNEHATYFWKGIPRIMRIRLENRLLAADPGRDLSKPFSVNEVNLAAEALLQRDRFDGAIDDSEIDEESMREEWSSDSETSDSESEDDYRDRKRVKRKSKTTKKAKNNSSEDESIKKTKSDSSKRKVTSGRTEVEGLIRQLNSMSNEDPGYGLTYYRAVKLDSDVNRVVRAPSFRATTQPLTQTYGNTSYARPIMPPPPPRPNPYQNPPVSTFQAQPPPHMSSANSYPIRPPAMGPQRREDMKCYGCGENGHGMSNCQQLINLINQGVLTKDSTGRIIKADGSMIRRIGNESFIEALEREKQPQSHLVTVEELFSSDSSSEIESDEDGPRGTFSIDYEDVYIIQGDKYDAYAAEKTEKRTTAKRKEIMDGVYPPPLKRYSERLHKDKENERVPREAVKSVKPIPMTPKRIKPERAPIVEINESAKIPVAKQAPRYDPDSDAEMIEDKGDKGGARKVLSEKNKGTSIPVPAPTGEKKTPSRQSAVSAHVDPMNVMNQLLNTRVTLAVGEVLGISRELSSMVSESIKVKSVKPSPVSVGLATSFRPKTRGLLIRITLECDGVPIEAIIDTGSQLNIVSEAIYKSRIRRPIDQAKTVNMNDANGGERTLQGLVKNVPLTCGEVVTEANLYVGEHVPFQLLLGRPWQRGNYVSIDERPDGTYLLFKDAKTLETRYEILVTPDNMTSVDWDFEPSTWQVTNSPASYLIEVPSMGSDLETGRDQNKEALIRDKLISNQSFLDKALNATNLGLPQGSITQAIMQWINSIKESDLENNEDKTMRDSQENINRKENYQQIPRRPLNILPHTSDMAINVASVPITTRSDDLPVLFSIAAPPRSEADDLRNALRHEDYLQYHGHFSNIALSSSQAYVTGYHTDAQGNKYTAITGLRSARTATTWNGPQTIYGHYVAHLYTDLDPVPSSVIIPTFHAPNSQESQSENLVSRNHDPSTRPTLISPNLINQQPEVRDTEITAVVPVERRIENTLPPPVYTPTTPTSLPELLSEASGPASVSSGDDENWLPCNRCHTTHGDRGCIPESFYTLVRVTSNGSVGSSVHILDDPPHDGSVEGHTRSNGTGDRDSRYSSPELVYPMESTDSTSSDSYSQSLITRPNGAQRREPLHSLESVLSTNPLPAISTRAPPNDIHILYPSPADEDEPSEDEDMDYGVLSLWGEYRKELTEEDLDSMVGKNPYQIIMELDDEVLERLAEAAIKRGPGLTKQTPTSGNETAGTDGPVQFQSLTRDPDAILVDSPIILTPQESRILTSSKRSDVAVVGDDNFVYQQSKEFANSRHVEEYRRPRSLPETFPFVYYPDYAHRPNSSSPIAQPEPAAVCLARISQPLKCISETDSITPPKRNPPARNDHRAFPYDPTSAPAVPPVTIYSTTTGNTQVFAIGAEPVSPASEQGARGDEQPQPTPRRPWVHFDDYTELEPVLRRSQEMESPPPTIPANSHQEQVLSPLHHNGPLLPSTDPNSSPERDTSPFTRLVIQGDRRPLPTRPNTPEVVNVPALTGEDLDRMLSHIEADSRNFSQRAAELKIEDAADAINVRFMHAIGNEYARAQIKTEPRGASLLKASPLRWQNFCETNHATDGTKDIKQEDGHSLAGPVRPELVKTEEPLGPIPSTSPCIPVIQRAIVSVKKPNLPPISTSNNSIYIVKKPIRPRDVPMEDRVYHPEQDYAEGTARARIGRIIALDMRNRNPVTGYENPPVADAYIRFVTIMAEIFEPYIFPDVVHNTPSGPYDLPAIRSENWGSRVDEMFSCRESVLAVIGRIENAMTESQIAELKRSHITMFVTGADGALMESTIDRQFFFRTLHPYHNPFVHDYEATFLRGACYHFRRIQQNILADAIDVLLRSPQYDDFYCRKLLEIGCLDLQTPLHRRRALDYIRLYEDEILADGDGESDSDADGEEDMDIGSDYEEEQID